MRIGVPKELKDNEFRVGLTPSSVLELTAHGHEVFVESGAGAGSGLTDAEYQAAGARILPNGGAIFEQAEMIVKVKEPLPAERALLRPGHVLFTYLHLAPDPQQTRDLMASGATCIAYETVTSPQGGLPLLTPMSEVAGRLAPQVAAHCLEKEAGGRGVLLGGVPGVPAGEVLILGGGVAGTHAAAIALGLGASSVLVTSLFGPAQVLSRLVNMLFGKDLLSSWLAVIAAALLPTGLLVLALAVPTVSLLSYRIVQHRRLVDRLDTAGKKEEIRRLNHDERFARALPLLAAMRILARKISEHNDAASAAKAAAKAGGRRRSSAGGGLPMIAAATIF